MRTLALRDIAGASHSAKRVFAACRVAGLTSLSPAASIQQIQMLSRPVRGTFAALQSNITNVANSSDGEVRPGSCRSLADAVMEGTEHLRMVAQIERLYKFDLGKKTGGSVGLRVDLFDENAGEQEVGKDDDPAEAEAGGRGPKHIHARLRHAGKGELSPAETHLVAQPVRELGDVGVGIRVAGAAPDDDEQGLSAWDRRVLCRRSDPVSRCSRQLWADRKIAPQADVDLRIVGHEGVHFAR